MSKDLSLEELLTKKERPTGVSILAAIHMFGGAVLLIMQVVMLWKFDAIADTLNEVGIPPILLVLGVMLLAGLGLASGIGMWIGTRWGWWCGAFYYVYSVARNANAFFMVAELAEQFSQDPHDLHGPGYYYAKFGGRVAIHSLLLLYFFKSNVLAYFGLSDIHKGKALLILIAITALIFGGSTAWLVGGSPVDDDSRLQSIHQQIDNGEYESALTEATQYAKDYPRSPQGFQLFGWAAAKSGQLELAKDCFNQCLSLDRRFENAYVGLGSIYRRQGSLVQSREAYLKAIELVPQNAEAYSSLVTIELLEGNDQQAVEYGEKAWTLRTDMPSIAANLAIAYHYSGDHAKRDEFYKKAESLGYHGLDALVDIFEGRSTIR